MDKTVECAERNPRADSDVLLLERLAASASSERSVPRALACPRWHCRYAASFLQGMLGQASDSDEDDFLASADGPSDRGRSSIASPSITIRLYYWSSMYHQ